jgi:RecB family exonuclease
LRGLIDFLALIDLWIVLNHVIFVTQKSTVAFINYELPQVNSDHNDLLITSCVLDQLVHLCGQYPIRKKSLFLPSLQTGYNLISSLTASDVSTLNLKTTTPSTFALDLIQPQLDAEGLKSLDTQSAPFLIERLLADITNRLPDHYFSSLPLTQDLLSTFLQLILDLRRANVSLDHLKSQTLGSQKDELISEIYAAYLSFLAQEQYVDAADILSRALASCTNANHSDTIFAILDETTLSALEYQFIHAISGGNIYRIGRDDYGDVPLPPHSAAFRFPDAPFPCKPQEIAPGGRLLQPDGLTPEDADRYILKTAIGVENEVRAIFQDILHQELPLDTVEIAYTVENPYLTLLFDTADALGLPVAYAGGIPIHLTRPGQALLGFYAWIASNFSIDELLSLCRADLLTFNNILNEDSFLDPQRAAGILQQRPPPNHRHAYARSLDRLSQLASTQVDREQDEDTPSEDPAAAEPIVNQTRIFVDKLLEIVPERETSVTEMANAGRTFLELFAPVRTNLDATAKRALTETLAGLEVPFAVSSSPGRISTQIRSILSQQKIATSVAGPGRLYVVPLDVAGYTNRPNQYVLGMAEGSFPGGFTEDPILLDHERLSISPELPLRRNRPSRNVWHLIRLLGVSPGKVTLTACTHNLADGRQTYPAALFRQAGEQMGGEDFEPRIPRPVPAADLALNEMEHLLAHRANSTASNTLVEHCPWLISGQDALESRTGVGYTRFDGILGFHPPGQNLADGTELLSASRLETLATCPRKYYLKYVLDISPLDTPVADPFVWLSPLELGSLLHDVFCTFMQSLKDIGAKPSVETHTPLIQEILQLAIDQIRKRVPVLHEAAYRSDCTRLTRSAEIFLASEAARTNVEPVAFEAAFGYPTTCPTEYNSVEPVRIRLSDRIELLMRGRIDRVDRTEEGIEVWDYKTGSTVIFDQNDMLGKGRHLQWALYAYALEEMLKPTDPQTQVVRSGYFFPGDRGGGVRIADSPMNRQSLADTLEPLLELARCGGFAPVHRHRDLCTYCEFARVCSNEGLSGTRLEEKLSADSENPEGADLIRRWIDA